MNNNRRLLMKSMAAVATLPMIGPMHSAFGAEMSSVHAVLKQAAESGNVPGVVAGVTNGSDTIFSAAYGVRGVGEPAPMEIDTQFFIASMTKPITSLAVVQLIEAGKIDLDEPVGKWVPELAEPMVLEGFDTEGKPNLRPAKTPITMRHLLTHTSGLVYDFWNADIGKYIQTQKVPSMMTATRASFNLPLVFDPGTRWEYGISMDWAGMIIEKISGMSLEEYFQKNIFKPLGMDRTSFFLNADMSSRLTKMHARGPDGTLGVMPFGTNQDNPEVLSGGSGLFSNVPDYLKFMRMILNKGSGNGNQLIKPETFDKYMAQNQIGDLRVHELKSAIPFITKDAEFFPGVDKTWSFGFMINEEIAPTGRSAGSLAWAGLANTYFWVDPVKDIAGVCMMQMFPFVDDKALSTSYNFEKSVYDSMI